MTRFTIRLGGCRTRPFASYLKALGVLRVVCQQKSAAAARGFWKDDTFFLNSALTEHDLSEFLLYEYSPTPLVTPWNGGSGFYPKDRKNGIDAISGSSAERFRAYREGIVAARQLIGERTKSPKVDEKFKLLQEANATWRGSLAEWFAAALVIDTEGEPTYPAILGTGGNDGRLDFTNNFMQRLAELFDMESENGEPRPMAVEHLREALFDDPITGMQSVAIGQFDPGAAGGTNSGSGFTTNSSVNLWDFVLMLEGSLAFAPALVRRANADGLNSSKSPKPGLPQAAAPFAVFNAAAGYATAVGDEKSRGEQWMPIWNRPTTYAELKTMLGQARCRVGDSPAKRPRDVAKAIARAGVARGFTGFERFAYLERNGQANLATPLGKWQVGHANPHVYLLDEIEEWFDRFDRAAAAKTSPESWARQARVIDDAIMNCCRPGATAAVWAELAIALGRTESVMIRNPQAAAKSFVRPLFYRTKGLSPQWISAIADRSSQTRAAEVRLAVALASQFGPRKTESFALVPQRSDPIRKHFLPLATKNGEVVYPPRLSASEDRLVATNDVVVRDVDFERELADLVQRRMLMLRRRNDLHFFPLVPTRGFEARLADLTLWIDGRIDSERLASLTRMLMAVNWDIAWQMRRELQTALGQSDPSSEWQMVRQHTGWALTRLCFHWNEITIEGSQNPDNLRATSRHKVPCDAAVLARMLAADGRGAVKLARERLAGCGIHARFSSVIAPRDQVRRWASSIAWSLSSYSINRLAQSVLNLASITPDAPPSESETRSLLTTN